MVQPGLTFTVKEFCGQASISPRLFYNLQEKGEGPKVIRIRRRVVIAQETAKRWLMDRETAAAPSKAKIAEPAPAAEPPQPSAADLAQSESIASLALRRTIPTGRIMQPSTSFSGSFGKHRSW